MTPMEKITVNKIENIEKNMELILDLLKKMDKPVEKSTPKPKKVTKS